MKTLRMAGLLFGIFLSSTYVPASALPLYSAADLGDLGGGGSEAWAVNDEGQVVGVSSIQTGGYRAFIWDRRTMISLGVLSGTLGDSVGYAINNLGQVTGSSGARAFVWHPDTPRMVPLPGVLAETHQTYGTAINDAGLVTVSVSVDNIREAGGRAPPGVA